MIANWPKFGVVEDKFSKKGIGTWDVSMSPTIYAGNALSKGVSISTGTTYLSDYSNETNTDDSVTTTVYTNAATLK